MRSSPWVQHPRPDVPMSQLESRWHYRTTSLCAWLTPLSRPTLAAASLICLYRPRPQLFVRSPGSRVYLKPHRSLHRLLTDSRHLSSFSVCSLTVLINLFVLLCKRGFSTPSLLWNGFATLSWLYNHRTKNIYTANNTFWSQTHIPSGPSRSVLYPDPVQCSQTYYHY